jgi:hypothetical protein
MKWFPRRKGTAMGFVVGGFGGGAMVFNQIQTAIVNPNNLGVRFGSFSQIQFVTTACARDCSLHKVKNVHQ